MAFLGLWPGHKLMEWLKEMVDEEVAMAEQYAYWLGPVGIPHGGSCFSLRMEEALWDIVYGDPDFGLGAKRRQLNLFSKRCQMLRLETGSPKASLLWPLIQQGLQLEAFQEAMLSINIGKASILVLILAQTLAFIIIICMLHHSPSSPVKKQNRMHVLIISTWRSGSSFTGQIYSQHPNVFYLMEPAWHVWSSMNQNKARTLHMAVRDLIRSAFLCDMSVFEAYMPPNGLKSTLFQWETSRALCSPPACNSFKRNDIIHQHNCKTLCANYPFEAIEQACKTYSHIVVKEVRFFDLKVLYPLLFDPSLNLKILHLVRDPRGVFYSREKNWGSLARDTNIILRGKNYLKGEEEYKVMEEICNSNVQMYKTISKTNSSRLKNSYLMVRYEDIVNEPILKADQLYKFADLHFTPELKTWIYNLTHGKGQQSGFVISARDALKVSSAWRESLQFQTIQRVQHLCKEAMDVFGYQHLLTEDDQKNVSLDLLQLI
ncbi:carbohydrate sulfotransferase 4 [Discoglossus pictus]